jgi:hypothetical protein
VEQPLVSPIALREHFESVIGVYRPDAAGKTLVELLKEDWALFTRLDVAHSKELLAEILDDGEIVRKRFRASERSRSIAFANWEELREELMHKNRFFPKTKIDLERLGRLLPFLRADDVDIPKTWYRARVHSTEAALAANEMGAPPKKLTSHGRANPAGIPYLYIASKAETAIAEVRPHAGDIVSVAEITIPFGLNILDLRHPRQTVSPFILADEQEIEVLRGDIEYLERLGNELTRPVPQRLAAFDYIPSQYLCEFAKNRDFDGVMYRSSVDGGINLALFEPATGLIGTVTCHTVARITVHSNAN